MNELRKCVYMHINELTQLPIYVGSGELSRAHNTEPKSRTREYEDMVNEIGRENIRVEILFRELTTQETEHIEVALIKKYGRKGIDEGGILANRRLIGGSSGANGITWTYTPEQLERHSEAMAKVQNRPETRLKKGRGGIVVKDLITGESTIYLCSRDASPKLNQLGVKCCHSGIRKWCELNDNAEPDSIVSPKRYPQLAFFYHDRWKEVFEVDKQESSEE